MNFFTFDEYFLELLIRMRYKHQSEIKITIFEILTATAFLE